MKALVLKEYNNLVYEDMPKPQIGPDDVLSVVGSGSVTLVDPADIEYSNLPSRADGEPVCLVNVRVHFLVDGWSFDLNTRTASHQVVMPA